MARPTLRVAQMTGLWRVKPLTILRWPVSIMNTIDHPMNARGSAGYVVDLDQPYEKVLLMGMEKFLEPVPPCDQESARELLDDPATWPRPIVNALAERKLLQRTPMRRPDRGTRMRENAAVQGKPQPEHLPGLDQGEQAAASTPKPATKGKAKVEVEGEGAEV